MIIWCIATSFRLILYCACPNVVTMKQTYHLLIHCSTFGVLWQHVKTWIDLHSVDPQHILDHFIPMATCQNLDWFAFRGSPTYIRSFYSV